jgi:hypothetical protein
MYSHSEDVPQSRGNQHEFLRLLKETAMGRIPDQEQQRTIIEFLDDIDPDYDPEFLELRNREGALGQVASQSEGFPTRTTANWKAIRDVSGLDIQRWVCFREYTPAEQALAVENVKGAYPGMSSKAARWALSQAITRYKNDHHRREQKKAKAAADAVFHAAGGASTPDQAASRVVSPISTPRATSQDVAAFPTLGAVASGGIDHDVLPMVDPASPEVGGVSRFGADSGDVVGVHSAGLAHVLPKADVASPRGARALSTSDSIYDGDARFSEQEAGHDGVFGLSIMGPAYSPGVGRFSTIADVSCPHVGDMASTSGVNHPGGVGGSTAGEAVPSSVGGIRGVCSTAAPLASGLGQIRVSVDGDLGDLVGNALQDMEVDVGSPTPTGLFRSMKEEAPSKDEVEIELLDGESGGMDAKGRRSEA